MELLEIKSYVEQSIEKGLAGKPIKVGEKTFTGRQFLAAIQNLSKKNKWKLDIPQYWMPICTNCWKKLFLKTEAYLKTLSENSDCGVEFIVLDEATSLEGLEIESELKEIPTLTSTPTGDTFTKLLESTENEGLDASTDSGLDIGENVNENKEVDSVGDKKQLKTRNKSNKRNLPKDNPIE